MRFLAIAALCGLLQWLPSSVALAEGAEAETLMVYSERREHLIEPIFELYTRETGIKVSFITDQAPVLIERLLAEGERTQADLLMAVDAGNLWLAADRGVLRAIDSDPLRSAVPAHLRDPDGRWYGLSVRARVIAYSSERVDPGELGSYADLADPAWKGRLCLRSSRKVYNQSLVAMMIARDGEEATEAVVRGWVENLAAPPFADDTLLLRAIAAGQCDVGIVNTYYFGRLQRDQPDIPVALHLPSAAQGGTHVNVAGAGLTRHGPNPEAAQRFLEWLAGPLAQQSFAGINLEYPIRDDIDLDPIVAAWGELEADPGSLAEAGRLQADAVRLMGRVRWR